MFDAVQKPGCYFKNSNCRAATGRTWVGWANIAALYKTAAVLKYHYYGPIEGRIVKVDRSASDALRLTLDRVVLRQLVPVQTPERVRVSLHGALFDFKPVPGETIMLTGIYRPLPAL